MGGTLNSILNKGSESLQNSQVAIDVTGHNISNAHTKGYSKQSVNLETKYPISQGRYVIGDGARIQSVARSHDEFIEKQLRNEIQLQSKTETLSKHLKKLEDNFNPDVTNTIRDELTKFHNALQDLSSMPEEPSVRLHLVETGKKLAQAFNTTHANIEGVQIDANEEIRQNLGTLNQKLEQIGKLNGQIREMSSSASEHVGDLMDQRDTLIKDVGSMININVYYDSNDQITVRGPQETLLVEGNLTSHLTIENMSSHEEMPHLQVSSFDTKSYKTITADTTKGKIGALLAIRDVYAAGLKQNINDMASEFSSEFNAIHREGYGINHYAEQTGIDFFTMNPDDDPAEGLDVNTLVANQPDAISSAITADAPGDNVIANKLLKLFHEKKFMGDTATLEHWYDTTIAKLGHDTAQSRAEADAAKVLYDKLVAERESVSGVSLDEEAANLMKYQHLFAASSRVVTTADQMFETILGLKR